jgi:predicted transcriptional regulator
MDRISNSLCKLIELLSIMQEPVTTRKISKIMKISERSAYRHIQTLINAGFEVSKIQVQGNSWKYQVVDFPDTLKKSIKRTEIIRENIQQTRL